MQNINDKKINTDLHESDHLMSWGLMVGVIAFTALFFLFMSMDFAFISHPFRVKDWFLLIFVLGLTVFFTALICRRFIYFLADYLNQNFLTRFQEIPLLGTYEESKGKIFNSKAKVNHAVLLLHGFTTSPQQLSNLIDLLEKEKITFYAPTILGFGLNSTQLLKEVRYEDWFRQALESFDLLQNFAEEVSVVGHSMGGVLATFVAEQRKVKHLILSSPAFISVPRDLRYKKILWTPLLSKLYIWTFPFLPKSIHSGRKTVSDTLDSSRVKKMFHYLAVPVNCVREFFKAQELIDLSKAHYQTLTFLYGKQDITIDTPSYLQALKTKPFKFNEYLFENSAHNIFEDFDRESVCERVVSVLKS